MTNIFQSVSPAEPTAMITTTADNIATTHLHRSEQQCRAPWLEWPLLAWQPWTQSHTHPEGHYHLCTWCWDQHGWGLPKSDIIMCIMNSEEARNTYLRECSIVPQVSMIGKAVVYKTNIALLDVLLDRVELFSSADLHTENSQSENQRM